MQKTAPGTFVYSPTDLTVYAASSFASWMERLRATDKNHPALAPRDEESAELKLVARKGIEHEATFLGSLRADGRNVAEIPRCDSDAEAETLTRTALASGAGVIFQACLIKPPFRGYADFLERVPDAAAPGGFSYEIVDTKLARSPKPYFVMQLCCYAEMLEAMTGRRPSRIHVVLGSNERRTYRTDDYFFAYLALKQDFLAFMEAFDPSRPPEPDPTADHGRYATHVASVAEAQDHLVRVAGITKGQIKKLAAAGIRTLTQLAESRRPRIPKMDDSVFGRLRDQARLQRSAAVLPEGSPPPFELIPPDPDRPDRGLAGLPPASALDVYADFEGYPLIEGGLEYLFGLVVLDGGRRAFHDWWAHDRAAEKLAFEGFIDFLTERFARDPLMHVYHYASYEVAAIKRLAGRHGTREDALDVLLRAGVFIDLLQVVRQGVRVGAESYSIKKIERLYRGARAGAVNTAGDSIVAYHGFIESGEPRDWKRSERLRQIRDYNLDDCDSTAELVTWLRARQTKAGIVWKGALKAGAVADDDAATSASQAEAAPIPAGRLRAEFAAKMLEAAAAMPEGSDARVLTELAAHFVGFHQREEKPFWWAFFERCEMSDEQLSEDVECLGGCFLDSPEPVKIKKSTGFRYRFDVGQETKLDAGAEIALTANPEIKAKIEEFDRETGRLLLKFGGKAIHAFENGRPPAVTSMIPCGRVAAKPQQASLLALAETLVIDGTMPQALEDLLLRRRPRIRGGAHGELVRADEDVVAGARRLALALDDSTLCVQGPPGAGKTYTGAHMILALVAAGRKVGVIANSHKAIENLLADCVKHGPKELRILKVGGDADELAAKCPQIKHVDSGGGVADMLTGFDIVGGTSWLFARADMIDAVDTLVVDEAGQFALANLAATARTARNLILLGDQMQLGQPVQGTHPGESGSSALDYLLQGRATIPPDLGLFLPVSWRMHPAVCRFISGAIYEDRLDARPGNDRRVIRVPAKARRITAEAGLVYVPVPHEGNSQSSAEEADAVREIYAELLDREKTGIDGRPDGVIGPNDVLIVAPYNMQVRLLKSVLPGGARVGSVDLFQGQEAAAVIVSMCASDAESSPRGLDFLLDRRRLNVAISRAKSLAIVVGSPELARARCSTVEQLALVNTYCRAVRGAT